MPGGSFRPGQVGGDVQIEEEEEGEGAQSHSQAHLCPQGPRTPHSGPPEFGIGPKRPLVSFCRQ